MKAGTGESKVICARSLRNEHIINCLVRAIAQAVSSRLLTAEVLVQFQYRPLWDLFCGLFYNDLRLYRVKW
jgi:hypothetical protein